MKTIVGYPGTGLFSQQIARAFFEHDALLSFSTSFAYRDNGTVASILQATLGAQGKALHRQLARRGISEIPWGKVQTHAMWEVMRTLASKTGASASKVDYIWDRMSHDFTRSLASQMRAPCEALYAYEYTALEAFTAAREKGIARILDLPSLSNHHFEEIRQKELAAFPELQETDTSYFNAKFSERQARRDAELASADVIMTNSRLTARSHIARGVDPEKIVTVPLAAPPTIKKIVEKSGGGDPLRVVWAGTFSIRKGAHYFLKAWHQLDAGKRAFAHVYGANALPDQLLGSLPDNLEFSGSVQQTDLFEIFRNSDVLIFPTLSDGFGMVISEAFAQGLPVMTTDQAGAAELVVHGKNGLVIESGNADAICDALEWCLDNRQELLAMRHAALATAKQWQWADYRAKLIQTLDCALRQAGYSPKFGLPREGVI